MATRHKNKFRALKGITKISDGSGGWLNLPLYTIFITPAELIKFAEVPSFKENDCHSDVANTLLNPPTKKWQRPLNKERVTDIGNYFGTGTTKTLMPNPILVGESDWSTADNGAKINVKPTLDSSGQAIEDVCDIEMINSGKKPLWILDGQHRTFGLSSHNDTKNEKIPVVLLIKNDAYVMEFLAQIFTEVTTGASDLEPIHKNWMQYSFGLGDVYKKGLSITTPASPEDRSMVTVIYLTTTSTIDSKKNELYDNIKFNPYDPKIPKAFNVEWTSVEWVNWIAKYYYHGSTTPLVENDLAQQIVRFLRAAKSLDVHALSDSRLFGTSKAKRWQPYKVLLNHLVWSFLRNLDTIGKKTEADWGIHLQTHMWDQSDWKLGWATGSQSSNWGRYSNKAAEFVMNKIFSSIPFTSSPDLQLKVTADITVTGYTKTLSGSSSNVNKASEKSGNRTININGGAPPWTTGSNRCFLEFSVDKVGVGSIVSMNWNDASGQNGKQSIRGDYKTYKLDLTSLSKPIDVSITTCSFNEASKSVAKYTIQW
tara:strand:- start:3645 stop:5261 length:1617 start_codon:yes stop_codon:yes gene_type:complete